MNQQISVATTTGRISWSDNFRIGVRLLPIKYSTERLQERFSRQDRQGRKGNFFSISPNFAPFAPLRGSSFIRSSLFRAKTAKNEIPISNIETRTNHDSNSKSEYRNQKQYQNSNDQNSKLFSQLF